MRTLDARAKAHVYTPEHREIAITLCALMASSDTTGWFRHATSTLDEDIHGIAADLARAALWSVPGYEDLDREGWAEAECRLREGWRP